MAPMAGELAVLRALTFRISSTPTVQLPQHVPAIAASLANCRSLFSSTQAAASKSASESSVVLHKYRTLLSSLLQDRTVQGRWAAIVLIKSTIEIGGWETLQKSLPWVRGLLGILTKPDPPSSKRLCLITLTRIFVLTRQYPTLVREITTPSLPPLIQSSLQLASSNPHASLLQTILGCFNQLLPRHATVFRSFLRQLHVLLGQTIAPTPSCSLVPEETNNPRLMVTEAVSAAARQLYTQLSTTAPKGASSEEWQTTFGKVIRNAHRTCDRVFRAVVEEWKSPARELPAMDGHVVDGEMADTEMNEMALPPWSGPFAGSERLIHLLSLSEEFLECPTTGPVNVDVGALIDLITRILSVTVPLPAAGKSFPNSMKFNNQISKDERECLWLLLPDIHVATIDVVRALARRCGTSTSPIDMSILDQLTYVFSAEKDAPPLRTACYLALAELLQRSGSALPKAAIDTLGPIVRGCCEDLLPSPQESSASKQPIQQAKANKKSQQTLTNADTFLNSFKEATDHAADFTGLWKAAHSLLTALFANIRPQLLSESLRTRMDRTSILLGHKDAMIMSVLNQPPTNRFGKPSASILPFLARTYPKEPSVETLIRPRMPVVRTGRQNPETEDESDESEQEEEIGEQDANEVPAVGDAFETLVQATSATTMDGADVSMAESVEVQSESESISADGPRNVTISDHMERDVIKRAQEEALSSSPAKRVKVMQVSEHTVERDLASEPTAEQPISNKYALSISSQNSKTETQHLQAIVSAKAPTVVSLGPVLTQPGDDSDDEDIVSLVLGQDTDEESD